VTDQRRKPQAWSPQNDDVAEEATKITAPLAEELAGKAPLRHRPCMIVIAGGVAGEVHALSEEETVLGRGQDAGIRIDDGGISRRHARVLRRAGGVFVLEDLASTNGTFVDDVKVTSREIREGDRIRLGNTVVLKFSMQDDLEHSFQKQMYESAVRDPLTRAFNRKYLMDRLGSELSFARRHGTSLSLLMLDIDHFKQVNDTWGHLAGDKSLEVLAGALQQQVRAEDVVARYGGEEFIILVRNVGGAGTAILAERVRRTIEALRIMWEGNTLRVTVSIGVAFTLDGSGFEKAEAMIGVADLKLYEAKQAGRNRVAM
jgi:diguanylate cyclase (GGDEF)-like protein